MGDYDLVPLLPRNPLHFYDGFVADSGPVVEVFLDVIVHILSAEFEMERSEVGGADHFWHWSWHLIGISFRF